MKSLKRSQLQLTWLLPSIKWELKSLMVSSLDLAHLKAYFLWSAIIAVYTGDNTVNT